MPAILYGFLSIWRRYFPTVATLLTLASIIGVACNVAAEEPKHIRITLARSVSAIPLWGIGPFAEKAGFRVEYIPAGTNADMQRNLQSGIELGTLGYQSPAVMAEQNVANATIVRMPDVAARLLEFGVIPEGDSSADFAAYIENEITKWKRVIEVGKIDKI